MYNDYVIILGASSGIGLACAKSFAQKGIGVIGIYLRKPQSHIESVLSDLNEYNVDIQFKKMNACNMEDATNFIHKISSIDNIRIKAFVHSLAFGTLKPFISNNDSDMIAKKNIDMTLDVMAGSFLYWSQEMFKSGIIKEGSQLMGMTSSGGRRVWQSYGAVSMAKAGLESIGRQLAFELSSHNIAVNMIQAGVTDTPALRKIPGYENMISHVQSTNPRGRLTTPEDVAEVVTQIGTSEHTWMTGNIINVDGGEDIIG